MLYKSAWISSSPEKRLEFLILIAGRRGAELLRDARLGRAVRGFELEIGGEAFVVCSPRLGSLEELEDRVRFDLARCGRTSTSSESIIEINGLPVQKVAQHRHPVKLSVTRSYG